MAHYSGFTRLVKLLKAIVLINLTLFFFCSCGSIMLPALKVVSCKIEDGMVSMEFSLPPDYSSLKKGLSVTEDGQNIEGKLSVLGNRAYFTPTYGIKENREYVVRVEAGTEDTGGHSLMDAFVYKIFTGNNKTTFTVEIIIVARESHKKTAVSQPLQEIQLNFSQAVDRESLEKGLSFSPSFDYFLEYEEADCLVRIIPKKELEVNQRYLLTLSPMVMDIYRNSLPKEVSWSFYYQKDTSPPQISFSVAQQPVLNQGLVELPPDEWIVLDFSEKINLDQLSSHVFLEPVGHLSLAPSLEIIEDYESGKSLKLRPKWNASEQMVWGKTWKLVVQPGIKDLGGNSIEVEQAINLSYTLENFRPPEFLGALITDKNQADLQVAFSPSNPFLPMILPTQIYAPAPETLPSTVELHLFFKVSSQSSGMNKFSLMENISLTASNDCCELTIKQYDDQDGTNEELYKSFISQINKDNEISNEDIESNTSFKIIGETFRVELVNRNQRGLVTLEVGSDLVDSLGNKLGRTSICQVNKI